jgi:hypothetical protein
MGYILGDFLQNRLVTLLAAHAFIQNDDTKQFDGSP